MNRHYRLDQGHIIVHDHPRLGLLVQDVQIVADDAGRPIAASLGRLIGTEDSVGVFFDLLASGDTGLTIAGLGGRGIRTFSGEVATAYRPALRVAASGMCAVEEFRLDFRPPGADQARPDPGTGGAVDLNFRCTHCGAAVDLAGPVHRCPVTQDTCWLIRDHDGASLFPYLPVSFPFFAYEPGHENPPVPRHIQ